MKKQKQIHPIPPIIDPACTCLILGSFPSVKSREVSFYYGHPQNRFWKILAALFDCDVPKTNEEKTKLLLDHHIALWDTIHSCLITGSSDASIEQVIPNDIKGLIQGTSITRIYCNGKASLKLYEKYVEKETGIPASVLPSSSPANAAYSLEKLIMIWKEELKRN